MGRTRSRSPGDGIPLTCSNPSESPMSWYTRDGYGSKFRASSVLINPVMDCQWVGLEEVPQISGPSMLSVSRLRNLSRSSCKRGREASVSQHRRQSMVTLIPHRGFQSHNLDSPAPVDFTPQVHRRRHGSSGCRCLLFPHFATASMSCGRPVGMRGSSSPC